MRGDRIDFWRRVHILLLGRDLDGTGYVVSPLDGVNLRAPLHLFLAGTIAA